ncbi:hypothetical protein SRHO_G00029700 [Serrasalmus rhombeus]
MFVLKNSHLQGRTGTFLGRHFKARLRVRRNPLTPVPTISSNCSLLQRSDTHLPEVSQHTSYITQKTALVSDVGLSPSRLERSSEPSNKTTEKTGPGGTVRRTKTGRRRQLRQHEEA